MDTRELHVLEVVGEFILRLRGNRSFPIKYTALRTRAQRLEDGTVMFGEPLSGHDHCRVEPWFRDWSEADNSQRLLQDGRLVDVLVLSQDLSRALSWRGVGHPPVLLCPGRSGRWTMGVGLREERYPLGGYGSTGRDVVVPNTPFIVRPV